jgi:hypothetical protein
MGDAGDSNKPACACQAFYSNIMPAIRKPMKIFNFFHVFARKALDL